MERSAASGDRMEDVGSNPDDPLLVRVQPADLEQLGVPAGRRLDAHAHALVGTVHGEQTGHATAGCGSLGAVHLRARRVGRQRRAFVPLQDLDPGQAVERAGQRLHHRRVVCAPPLAAAGVDLGELDLQARQADLGDDQCGEGLAMDLEVEAALGHHHGLGTPGP